MTKKERFIESFISLLIEIKYEYNTNGLTGN